MRFWAVTAVTMLTAIPAAADDLRPAIEFSAIPPVRPADRGKPMIFVPPPLRPAPEPCQSPLPCGTRIVGAIERNGAVELAVPVWRW